MTPTPTTVPGAGAAPEASLYAADWPFPNRDYNNSRASTDSPINASNVNTLNLTWAYNITGIGTFGGGTSNPIILGDTIFFQDLKANVIAFDRTTGAVKWMKEYNASFVEGPNGPTAGYGKIFVAKDAYSMAALNATTGDELWSQRLSFVNTTGIDIAPAAYGNMVYTSTVPGTGDLFYAPGGIGYIYGLDQETGAIVWNVSTVDTPDLWGHPEVNSGGGCWYTPGIDTTTGMTYWAISNPAPFPGTAEWPSGSSRPGPNLYTNSLMALDHMTGTMNWFTQVLPHDLFDHDLQIAPILASANVNGTQQEIVLSAGKMGTVYAFNRSTGALLWQTDVGEHNGNDKLDVLPNGTTTVIPSALGGVETPMAYADGVVYVPVVNLAMNWTPTSIEFSSVNFSAGTGDLVALDVNTGEMLWDNKLDSVNVGAATVVNDLVFTATFDGTIYAFNRTDGAQLWTYKAPSAVNGWPAVAGNTIVWPAGGAGSFGNNATPLLLAFSLPGGGNQTNVTPTVTTVPSTTTTTMEMTTAPTTAAHHCHHNRADDDRRRKFDGRAGGPEPGVRQEPITVPAGSAVTVNFNNMDSGVPHNFAVYTDATASTAIFTGAVVTGPTTTTYTFTAPSTPGTYFFRCDLHPTLMTGQFIVT